MSTRVPEVFVKIDFDFPGFCTGTYHGTVNSAGKPHGRGHWDSKGGLAGYAYSGDWVDGAATGEGWLRFLWNGDVYAGAVRGGLPHGYGVWHRPGEEPGHFEGEFEDGAAVGEGVLLLAGPTREVWLVRAEVWSDPFLASFWDGSHRLLRQLELFGRLKDGGPPAPRREDGGRLPGPAWAAWVERPEGTVVRGCWRRLAEVCGARLAAAAAAVIRGKGLADAS